MKDLQRRTGIVLTALALLAGADWALEIGGLSEGRFHWLNLSEAMGSSAYPDIRNITMEQGVFQLEIWNDEGGPSGVWVLQSTTNIIDTNAWITVPPVFTNASLQYPIRMSDTNLTDAFRHYRVLRRTSFFP